ncbi:hypothetical protein SEA_RYADEL_80 [Mycobacterium phage Ryadel]|uniref:Uncharacterized protein n=1 Tax=Mycobacterium phage Ryadel TaxID=2283292 RepID=A0A345MF47_9CAUD|nr:hypothetical protein KNU03_gp080 [Mycobacterium phage Ryadel]AYQ98914.1 hypothetical protein SEA_VORRPS_77 [Mycobacterium phage Vorrps]QXO13449.1 hypothetical protein SEA_MURAI_77 [Mycobacterium phage Murai]UAW08428.1 hypothetical protein SEA_MORI_77 [Mycobacterium phage Mori]WNO28662.1 hypothetical protein SEA_MADKILLAH_78 [Mycobacterium phage MadKillah]AXH69178.1 hypothetical protein SEA_RYADEL_80 [Mycobacterium phage Ryadel]
MRSCTCSHRAVDHWIAETLDGEEVLTSCRHCDCEQYTEDDTLLPSELLAAAEQYLDEHGWAQERETAKAGEVCALMALRSAAMATRTPAVITAEASRALEEVAQELYSKPISIPMFNDLHCVDEHDARNWISKARIRLEEAGR